MCRNGCCNASSYYSYVWKKNVSINSSATIVDGATNIVENITPPVVEVADVVDGAFVADDAVALEIDGVRVGDGAASIVVDDAAVVEYAAVVDDPDVVDDAGVLVLAGGFVIVDGAFVEEGAIVDDGAFVDYISVCIHEVVIAVVDDGAGVGDGAVKIIVDGLEVVDGAAIDDGAAISDVVTESNRTRTRDFQSYPIRNGYIAHGNDTRNGTGSSSPSHICTTAYTCSQNRRCTCATCQQ